MPQNIQRSLPKKAHIQLELDHTTVWYMQGAKTNAKILDYYLAVEDIFFRELSQQEETKVPIPAKAKETDFSIEEPLTD